MAGGSFPPGDSAPRAVSEEFFNHVCPAERRTNISIKAVNEGLEYRPVMEVIEKYVKLLKEMPDGCVELYGGLEHPFDWM